MQGLEFQASLCKRQLNFSKSFYSYKEKKNKSKTKTSFSCDGQIKIAD